MCLFRNTIAAAENFITSLQGTYAADAAAKRAIHASVLVHSDPPAIHAADVQRRVKGHGASGSRGLASDGGLPVHGQVRIPVVSVHRDVRPNAGFKYVVGPDDGQAGTNIEAELQVPVFHDQRQEVLAPLVVLRAVHQDTVLVVRGVEVQGHLQATGKLLG